MLVALALILAATADNAAEQKWRALSYNVLYEQSDFTQVLDAIVGDAALPGHPEVAQVRKMTKHLQAAIGEAASGILAQIEPFQLRHAREVRQPGTPDTR